MMIYLSISFAVLLLFVLSAIFARSMYSARDLNVVISDADSNAFHGLSDETDAAIYLEILLKIFNDDDRRFVASLGNSQVEKLLCLERKRIAIGWIHCKEMEARSIMRDHVRRARTTSDLSVPREIKLVFHYIELLMLCELLILLILFFGPSRLQGLAMQTNGILSGLRRADAALM